MNIFDNVKRECDDNMRIFLRLRPANQSSKDECYETPNDQDIVAIPPDESASYRNFINGYGKTSQKFTFSKLFPGTTRQDCIFDETTKSLLVDFAKGGDRLLFTYGTTSSGKTYTMTGNKRSVGIIPRSLSALFNSTQLSNDASIMPIDFSEVVDLSALDLQRILREKSALLKLSEKESSELLSSLNGDFNEILPCDKVADFKTTFWVTFTEIYNEMIYDLLDVAQCQANAGNKNMKRPILDIRTARNGGSYVKGLSCYPVFSAEEAYRLFMVGRRSQKTGATRLNTNSSRSHTIFTIRSVRTTTASQYLTRVSNLSFCDLAGSERTAKAQTSGISQKEANNINSSLLTLGRCIEVLRRNQTNPTNMSVVPFRDSKLTRLFQTYLTGNGLAAMIVCVNPDRLLFDETIQVLKFSAIARKVVLQEKEKVEQAIPLRRSHFARLGLNTPKKSNSVLAWDSDEDLDELDETLYDGEEEEYNVEELLNVIESLKAELLATKKEKIVNEARITDRLNDEWTKTILKMENDHSDRMQELRDQMNENMLKRVKVERNNAYAQLKKRKLQYESSDDEEKEDNGADMKLAAKDRELNELGKRLKEAEEDSVDARARLDEMVQKLEESRICCKQHEFTVSSLATKLEKMRLMEKYEVGVQTDEDTFNWRNSDSNNSSILTIEANCSVRSSNSSMSNSRLNRFSSFTLDPSLRVHKHTESHAPPQGYFGPVKSPLASFKLKETATVKKKVHAFVVHEEDIEDVEDSFLDNEAEAKISELESLVEQQEHQLARKTVEIKTLNQELASSKNEVKMSTVRLIQSNKEAMELSNNQRYIGIKIDAIAKNLKLQPSNVDVTKKLELILTEVSNTQSRSLEPLKESYGDEQEDNARQPDSASQENIEPGRVTRSRATDGQTYRPRQTRRKK